MPVWGVAGASAFLAIVAAVAVPSILDRPSPTSASELRPVEWTLTERPPVAVFFGDSYTTGAGSKKGGYVTAIAREQKWSSRNLARGGTGFIPNPDQTVEQARTACGADYCESFIEQIPAAVKIDPEIVVVNDGRNGVGANPDVLRESIGAFFEELRVQLPDATIYVTSPLWQDETAPDELNDLAEWERAAAESVDATFLDLGQPLEGRPDLIGPDKVHPNEEGYQVLAASINAGLSR